MLDLGKSGLFGQVLALGVFLNLLATLKLNLIERLEKLKDNQALFEEQIVYWFYHIVKGVDCLHNNNLLFCQISEK